MDHDESIYNLIPTKPLAERKPPMYRSNFSGVIKNPFLPRPPKVIPAKVPTLSQVMKSNPSQLLPSKLKPCTRVPVPKKETQTPRLPAPKKNFVISNTIDIIMGAGRRVLPPPEPQEPFRARVPEYLEDIKSSIEMEYNFVRQLQLQQRRSADESHVRPLQEAERLELVDGLKAKYENVNREYQRVTHLMHGTFGQRKRKKLLEAELVQIEKDLERLTKLNLLIDQRH